MQNNYAKIKMAYEQVKLLYQDFLVLGIVVKLYNLLHVLIPYLSYSAFSNT
jgi:hypothetical protein